ncbi:hypothetical protein Tco_0622198 [Tanacetum coccineum]
MEIRPVWKNAQRVNHQNKCTHPHPKRNFVPTAVVTKSGQVPVNTAKQSSPRAAASISTVRPINTIAPKSKVNDALPKTYSYFKHAGFGDQQEMLLTIPPKDSLSIHAKKNLIMVIHNILYRDQRFLTVGCSRLNGNKSFLIDYQEIDGGFVAFGGSPKGGKITGKDKIRTEKLDFEDVYFVKELKFNLFFLSQTCDKKNNVLFTKTECLILSPDFKATDEIKSCLKFPAQNNMYSLEI